MTAGVVINPFTVGFYTFKSLLDASLFRLPTVSSARAAFAGSGTERSHCTCVNVVCVPPEDRLLEEKTHSVAKKLSHLLTVILPQSILRK